MSRMFITVKEIDFANDIRKEAVKDVVGQRVYYYPVIIEKSKVDEIYNEADIKITDYPLILDALVEFMPEEIKTGKFGPEKYSKIKFYIPYQDLMDRGIDVKMGDFFTYGNYAFEVTKVTTVGTMYGQIEYLSDWEIQGVQAREGVFVTKIFGPRPGVNPKEEGVEQVRHNQQRGFAENAEGETQDHRALEEKGRLEHPISGPNEMGVGSEFYGPKTENTTKKYPKEDEQDDIYKEWK